MPPFFLDLVTRSDEARRAFETHPSSLDAVAHGHARWSAIERCCSSCTTWSGTSTRSAPPRRAASATSTGRSATTSTSTCTTSRVTSNGCSTISTRSACRADTVRTHRPSPATLGAQRLQLLGGRPPPPVLGARHAVRARGHRLGVRRAVRVGAQGIAAAARRARRLVHRLARHAWTPSTWPNCAEVLNTLDDAPARDAVVESTLVNFHHFTRIIEVDMSRQAMNAAGVSADAVGRPYRYMRARMERRALGLLRVRTCVKPIQCYSLAAMARAAANLGRHRRQSRGWCGIS